jgi:hypothetical protein
MSSHHGLAIYGSNVADDGVPEEVFGGRWRGHIGIGRKLGKLSYVFEVQDNVCRVDPQDCGWRDLRQTGIGERRT